MPDFLVSDFRGHTDSAGPVRVAVMRGGLVFEKIGTDIANAGQDPSLGINMSPEAMVVRFFGQIWVTTRNGAALPTQVAIRPYDEGGIDDWQVFGVSGAQITLQTPTAKGARGASIDAAASRQSSIIEVLTADGPYLCGTHQAWSPSDRAFWAFNPETNSFTNFIALITNWSSATTAINGIAHDGLAFFVANEGMDLISSFDPASNSSITYLVPIYTGTSAGNQRRGQFFTLHDRLFCASLLGSGAAGGENDYVARIVEFGFGVWTESSGVDTNMGDAAAGGRFATFKISPNKVLLIGPGSQNDPNGGLVANVISTVGDAAAGALQNAPGTIATTNAVIPLALRPPGGSYGGLGSPVSGRCYGTTVTDDPTGVIRHFMYYMPDGGLATSIPTLFEVFDDVTPIVPINQTPQMDSNFSFPASFYGGGGQSGGLDGSTRYVSAQARGWEKGNTGVRVKVSAHGDAMILSYHNLVGGPFTAGEVIQGAGGGEGTLIGDGAGEGLFLRSTNGTPFVGDEQITGLSSGATADLDLVLVYDIIVGSLFEVGEVVTGQSSGAVGTIKRLGLGGPGETVFKVEWTNSPTAFTNGEQILGGTSAATTNLTSAPLGSHGGDADKTIRARFFNSATGGKGVPSGFATMIASTGIGGTVSKGSGPGASDELINVVADGAVGDTPVSFEWDFLADGVPAVSVAQMVFEIDRT